jgi:hypothetical protein
MERCHARLVLLILPNIDIVEPGFIVGLLLDPLSYLAACEDFVPMMNSIDRPEAAFLDLVPTFQPFNHLHMGSRIIEVHIE